MLLECTQALAINQAHGQQPRSTDELLVCVCPALNPPHVCWLLSSSTSELHAVAFLVLRPASFLNRGELNSGPAGLESSHAFSSW